MTSLIIGGSSNLAIELRNLLESSGKKVQMLGRNTNHVQLDLESQKLVGIELIKGITEVFICASSFESDTLEGIKKNLVVNTNGTSIILKLLEKTRPKKVTYAGTVFSDPAFDPSREYGSYAFSKKICEDILIWWCLKYGVSFRSVRLSQLVDSHGNCCKHQPWIGRIVGYAARGMELSMPGSIGVRNFLHIEDAALIMSRAHECEGSVINGSNPNGISYHEIASEAFDLFSCSSKLKISKHKEKFKGVFPPKTPTIFELLNIAPSFNVSSWLRQIKELDNGLNFGPIDVL